MSFNFLSKRKFSITSVLAVSMSFLMVFMMVAMEIVQYNINKKNTLELLSYQAWYIIDSIDRDIAHSLDPAKNILKTIAKDMVGFDRPSPEGHFLDLVNKSLIGSISYTDQDGNIHNINLNNNNIGVLPPIRIRDSSLNKQNKTTDFNQNNNPALLISQPIENQGGQGKFIESMVELDSLSQTIVELSTKYNGTAFLLKGDNVLAHPKLTEKINCQEITGSITIDQLQDKFLTVFKSNLPIADGFDKLKKDNIDVNYANIDNNEIVFISKKMYKYGEEPLVVGVWFYEDDVFTQLDRLYHSIIVGNILLIIGIILAIVLGRKIAKPIVLSSKVAKKIEHFNLDKIDLLPPSIYAELDMQSKAFNSMLGGLQAFSRYIPKNLVERLIREGVSLGDFSEERRLTIMFTDIVGYTSFSELLSASEVASFLNHHFTILGKHVEQEMGTIDKFIGDALMAFWGAPEILPDGPLRACRTALNIKRSIESHNEICKKEGKQTTKIRIGIHTGQVVVGNIGSEGRVNYTVVGDTVNTTQRLESLGKEYQQSGDSVTIIISSDVYEEIKHNFDALYLGKVDVKGKKDKIDIYKLIKEI